MIHKLFLITPIAIILLACTAEKENENPEDNGSENEPVQEEAGAIQKTALNACIDQYKQKYADYKNVKVNKQEVHPIEEVKLALKDQALEKQTAFVSNLEISTQDSLHHCSCYHNAKGKIIGGHINSEHTAPKPTGYAADFEQFKSAVLNKDKEALQAMIKDTLGPGITPEDVLQNIGYLDQKAVQNELTETKYEDLLDTELSNTVVKDFTLEEKFTTTEGEQEVGMALNFYFLETKAGLKLIYMITPG